MTSLKTIGILSPGDMGHTIGKLLLSNGLNVIACLKDRSERTRSLAREAGIVDVSSYRVLVQESEMILSILVPAQARNAAEKIAAEIKEKQHDLIFVDCNAISPMTIREIGRIIEDAGGRFVDVSIIGGPPSRTGGQTYFYASGPAAETFGELSRFGLDVRVISQTIGDASAIKMCYSAISKGMSAIHIEVLTAAKVLGISEPMKKELIRRQPKLYERMKKKLPTVPAKSRRWVGEMEEMAATFDQVGLTPKIFQGAADIYRFLGKTTLAEQTPENRDPAMDLEKIISSIAQSLSK